MLEQMSSATNLPIIFMCLVGLSVFIYAILDGYDLGVGILLPIKKDKRPERDQLIASIGPFWDANETWLVLAIGLLLIAFPSAYSIILNELYIPATLMLLGLILRGVAFDFRTKAIDIHQNRWDLTFKFGSILTAVTQGYMLGRYVLGFQEGLFETLFACASAFCVTAAYAFIGGGWLVMKLEGPLQQKFARYTRISAWFAAFGILLVSLVNPLTSNFVYQKWLGFPQIFILFPIPVLCAGLFLLCDRYLKSMPHNNDFGCWIPFCSAVFIFFLCFQALAYSFFPYVIPGELDVWQAASAAESLRFILVGALIVIPFIIAYTIFSYRVFWGKSSQLHYY